MRSYTWGRVNVMIAPNSWKHPLEKVSIFDSYPKFRNFVSTSEGSLGDCYNFPAIDKVYSFLNEFRKF
ncbi:MAG: DUF4842 domain-containing protein [Leptospiraceae bacterium]|nr:DUF4842 domain-containing protein [Leptospiraceae bacterium]MCP5511812.1 DUF4842 domain-containing protein [Leptospiraceae bacterium]